MKKKKVDKILKGVVTAGVALGGASFMTEADMVYAATTTDENVEESAEKIEGFEEEAVNEGSLEEVLD